MSDFVIEKNIPMPNIRIRGGRPKKWAAMTRAPWEDQDEVGTWWNRGAGMRVLVGCEESGRVRDAFIARGHDAWSNDLIPARTGGPHLQMDVRQAIIHFGPWDIIIIHYDCTAMAVSGNRWYGYDMPRHDERLWALDQATDIWWHAKQYARVGCCFENPVSVLWNRIGKPQYIQPWQFGHGETKKTGLRLHNLPELIPTGSFCENRWDVCAPGIHFFLTRLEAEAYVG